MYFKLVFASHCYFSVYPPAAGEGGPNYGPGFRYYSFGLIYISGRLYLYSGNDAQINPTNDFWTFDLVSKSWFFQYGSPPSTTSDSGSPVIYNGTSPAARNNFACAGSEDSLWFYGGYGYSYLVPNPGGAFSDLWSVRIGICSAHEWYFINI